MDLQRTAAAQEVALQRLQITIEYLDGTEEEIEAVGKLDLGSTPGFVMISTSRNEAIGINLQAVRKWKATASKLSVVGN